MEDDADERIDGFVATLGRRLWSIDRIHMIISQLYEIECLSVDPCFVEGETKLIVKSYSYDDLVPRYAE